MSTLESAYRILDDCQELAINDRGRSILVGAKIHLLSSDLAAKTTGKKA